MHVDSIIEYTRSVDRRLAKILARVDPSHTIQDVDRVHVQALHWSMVLVFLLSLRLPLSFAFALPPKLARSPFSAMIDPPLVISQSRVVMGRTQVFMATQLGSPGSWTSLSLVSAYAVIVSAPGSVDHRSRRWPCHWNQSLPNRWCWLSQSPGSELLH
jgi:hypothetical protein